MIKTSTIALSVGFFSWQITDQLYAYCHLLYMCKTYKCDQAWDIFLMPINPEDNAVLLFRLNRLELDMSWDQKSSSQYQMTSDSVPNCEKQS